MSLTEMYTITIVHVVAIPTVLYPLVYRGVPWRKGPTGKALMNMARSLALLFVIAIVGYWWPFPGFPQMYAAAVTYLGGAITYQLHVMWRMKRHAQRRQQVLAPYTVQQEDLPLTHTTRGT